MSTALKTITDYINDARVLLQDTLAPYRYDDDSLVTAMNVTLLEGRRIRPDLFIFRRCQPGEGIVQSFQANDGTIVDMEEQFRLAFLHGMCGHALERDQEDIQDQRATMFLNIFNELLLGVRVAGVHSPQVPT